MERQTFLRIAKDDVEMRENTLTTQQVESYAQPRRETDGNRDLRPANPHLQMVNIHGNQAAISDDRMNDLSLREIQTEQPGFGFRKDRQRGAGIDVRPYRFLSRGRPNRCSGMMGLGRPW